jgi:hypothetical protein
MGASHAFRFKGGSVPGFNLTPGTTYHIRLDNPLYLTRISQGFGQWEELPSVTAPAPATPAVESKPPAPEVTKQAKQAKPAPKPAEKKGSKGKPEGEAAEIKRPAEPSDAPDLAERLAQASEKKDLIRIGTKIGAEFRPTQHGRTIARAIIVKLGGPEAAAKHPKIAELLAGDPEE